MSDLRSYVLHGALMLAGAALYAVDGFAFDDGGGISFDNGDAPMSLLIIAVGVSMFLVGFLPVRRKYKSQRAS